MCIRYGLLIDVIFGAGLTVRSSLMRKNLKVLIQWLVNLVSFSISFNASHVYIISSYDLILKHL